MRVGSNGFPSRGGRESSDVGERSGGRWDALDKEDDHGYRRGGDSRGGEGRGGDGGGRWGNSGGGGSRGSRDSRGGGGGSDRWGRLGESDARDDWSRPLPRKERDEQ